MKLAAAAKVNLTLHVFPPDRQGYHPLRSWAVSVGWTDELSVDWSEDGDDFTFHGPAVGEDFPIDESNLVWQAVRLARSETGLDRPMRLELTKNIPTGAGLAGGSADAAAALVALDELMGTTLAPDRAPKLGSDIRFCLSGGSALMEGRGERLTPHPAPAGVVLGIVVPPFELSTAAVYASWDRLGGPEGKPVPARRLPPGLRDGIPLRNDLYPAALVLEPAIGEWMAELERRWGCPVLMSGSGSALFGMFGDLGEASEAVSEAPSGHRGVRAAELNSAGVEFVER